MSHRKSLTTLRLGLIAAAVMTLGSALPFRRHRCRSPPMTVATASAQRSPTPPLRPRSRPSLRRIARVTGSDISVTTSNGVVKLTGSAASADAKTAAGEIAANTDGVKHVKNKLKAPSVFQSLKNSGKSAAGSIGSEASDTWITTKVKSSMLTDSELKGSVEVTTNQGVVVLTGQVPNQASRDRAVALAKQTKGVKMSTTTASRSSASKNRSPARVIRIKANRSIAMGNSNPRGADINLIRLSCDGAAFYAAAARQTRRAAARESCRRMAQTKESSRKIWR